MYPWAKLDILQEVSISSSTQKIQTLRHAQALSPTGFDKDVVVVPCKPEEPICKNCIDKPPFCFFYETLFIRLGVRLPLSPFEK